MPTLIPIKVKIGLRPNGHADHPDWTQLPLINIDQDVKRYVPFGWVYDKASGHDEARTGAADWDSPVGFQWGCLLVMQVFADEALVAFPALVTKLSEAEYQDFYDNKAMGHLPENRTDVQVLQALQIELDLKEKLAQDTTALKAKIAKAIDPADDTEPGIKKNTDRKWVDLKAKRGIIVALAIE